MPPRLRDAAPALSLAEEVVVMKWLSFVPLAGMLAIAGCDGVRGCDVYVYYYDGTVEVTAVDAVTGAPVPNATMALLVSPIDTAVLSVGSDVSKYPVDFTGLSTGTFQLAIVAPGYATWRNTVSVMCAKPSATVTARLEKSP
ncbi:MAG: PEGA domain-containing protein [Gemmatimonadales bacterium]